MGWNDVWLFIQNWWLELILGGIGTGLGFVARHYYSLAKKDRARQDADKKQLLKDELTAEVKALVKEVKEQVHLEIVQESTQVREEMAEYETNDGERITALENRANILEDTLGAVANSLDAIRKGLLAVQGHEFREKCRKLLRQEVIKPEEYEQLETDHTAYNGLGGNHKGDSLFDQVKTKYYAQLK